MKYTITEEQLKKLDITGIKELDSEHVYLITINSSNFTSSAQLEDVVKKFKEQLKRKGITCIIARAEDIASVAELHC